MRSFEKRLAALESRKPSGSIVGAGPASWAFEDGRMVFRWSNLGGVK